MKTSKIIVVINISEAEVFGSRLASVTQIIEGPEAEYLKTCIAELDGSKNDAVSKLVAAIFAKDPNADLRQDADNAATNVK